MTNNDILRRIRYIFDFSNSKMIEIFQAGGQDVVWERIKDWLKKEEDAGYKECRDAELTTFLDGLIDEKRGKKEGARPKVKKELNNNVIFMKLKIALDLKAEEILEIMNLAGLELSKHELSAFFRNPNHKHYRECRDQILRNFLKGIQMKYRPNK